MLAMSLLTRTAMLLAVFVLAQRVAGPDGRLLAGLLLFVGGGMVAMPSTASSLAEWAAMAALAGAGMVALGVLLRGHDARVVPTLLAATAVLSALRSIARHAYPDVVPAACVELLLIALVTVWWLRTLGAPGVAGVAEPARA